MILQPDLSYHRSRHAYAQQPVVQLPGIPFAGLATTRPAPPLAPHPPTSSAITASSFKLSWASPQARGAPITEYLVSVHYQAVTADSTSASSAGPTAAAAANGHAESNGNGVMDSTDDASSTSGSTAHVQVSTAMTVQQAQMLTVWAELCLLVICTSNGYIHCTLIIGAKPPLHRGLPSPMQDESAKDEKEAPMLAEFKQSHTEQAVYHDQQ